jgi:hypothetical protein
VTFAVQDADNPADSSAYAAWRAGGKVLAARRVPKAQQVLGEAFDGDALELLSGDSGAADSCCSTAGVVRMRSPRSFGRARALVRGLAGATEGQLVAFSGRLLAAVATERGVWVAQSYSSDRFGPVHLLSSQVQRPEALRAIALHSGGTVVAWTARDRTSPVPRRIFIATGTVHSAPGGPHTLLSVPSTRRIDELAIADGANGASVAWIASWYDRRGAYHSQPQVADMAHPGQSKAFPIASTVASGLSFASDPGGDQVLAWKTCTAKNACVAHAVIRRAGHRFTRPIRLDSIDAAESPVAALAPSGEALVGWIDRGHVLAAELPPDASRFGGAQVVSSTNFAADLALGFAPSGFAIAAWSQGTLAPDVIGTVYRRP